MKRPFLLGLACALAAACSSTPSDSGSAGSPARGWLAWRGPNQNGTSSETGLFDQVSVGGENHLWSYDIAGRGTPVIAGERLYARGYVGEGETLEEVLFCLDARTGELLWEHRDTDFLSDIIYTRYAIGSPTVDPETGNVFAHTAGGLLQAFTADGDPLWEASLTESLGRLSYPNGRTGAPLVLGDQVIVHFMFSSWGPLGPARNRFFGLDKNTGEVLWSSTPGGPPKDSSFSFPVVEDRDGRLLLYAGLTGGNVACVDARTGEVVWRYRMCVGGVNGSPLLYGDRLIAIHGKENVDTSTIGRMISLDLEADPSGDLLNLPASAELWRNDLEAFTSSPVLVGDRVYQTTQKGDLACVDADSGEVLWHEKIASDQLHASPAWADGKLYVPMNNGTFFVVRPTDEGMEILDREELDGNCLGAPAIAGGRVYVHTTQRLYCFGEVREAPAWTPPVATAKDRGDEASGLRVQPADVTVRAGDVPEFRAMRVDALGRDVAWVAADEATVTLPEILTAGVPGSDVVTVSDGELTGKARVRTVPRLPLTEDFESTPVTMGGDDPFGLAPGYWLQGRAKWWVKKHEDGGNVCVRRIENPLFQRTMSLFGHPDDANYTFQADVMTDGNRRTMSTPGLVNQRYLFALKGNYQELEISSNMERFKVSVPFKIRPGVWYSLKTRVDVAADGSGVVRAKAWPRDEAEPEAWTLEASDPNAHTHGAPGVYGFTPQSRFAVYLDNLSVTPNE